MAPTTVAKAFQTRKLRSASASTPKKSALLEENRENVPATEKKRGRAATRCRSVVKNSDELLRGVAGCPAKGGSSPMKKKQPLGSIQLNSQSPVKILSPRKNGAQASSSPKKNVTKALFAESQSPQALFKVASLTRSHLAEARACLSIAMPDQMVGREKQLKTLRTFLEDNLTTKGKGKTPSKKKTVTKKSIYVSGPPGTGKTTCLKRLLAELPTTNKIRTVFVNCMSLGRSGGIFGKVADALCPKRNYGDTNDARRVVEEEIINSKDLILLVLDEVDQLDSKSQDVLYTLFEWPYLNKSKLVLVGIANALDLTDRILPRLKLRDAFCPAELTFPAYTRSEIVSILKGRLAPYQENVENPLFQAKALEFLAGKIAALSGDVRKAIDVCRRAVEVSEVEARTQMRLKPQDNQSSAAAIRPIDVPKIVKIVNEIYCSSVTKAMSKGSSESLPMQQKLLMACLLLMTNHGNKNKEISLGMLHSTYAKVCRKRSMQPIDLSEAGSMCGLLESRGLLAIRSGGPWASAAKDKKVRLRIDEREVEDALKDKNLLSGILADIDCIAK